MLLLFRFLLLSQRVAVCYYAVALMELLFPRWPPPYEHSRANTDIGDRGLREESSGPPEATGTAASARRPTVTLRAGLATPATSLTLRGALQLPLFLQYRLHWLAGGVLLAVHTAIMYGVKVPPREGFSCGRGVLTPVCNAASYVDEFVFGKSAPRLGSICTTRRRIILHSAAPWRM